MSSMPIDISGLGVVSPLGSDLETYWANLLCQDSRPQPDPSLRPEQMAVRNTYRVPPEFEPAQAPAGGGRARWFAMSAARACLRDAGLTLDQLPYLELGCCLGSAMGDDVYERGQPTGVDCFSFGVASGVAQALSLSGPCHEVSTACSAGLYAISIGADWIRGGMADAVLVGGSEAICRVAMGCFNRLAGVDPECCRPFDAERRGAVMGEGAALLLLESRAHRLERGWNRSYAEVAGDGWSCDAHHSTIPEASGAQPLRAAREALRRAGITASELGAVMAHGTGTPKNDAMESRLVEMLLGDHSKDVWISGVKGKLGHGGGAAGAFQALTGALALERQVIPPTGNLKCPERDPETAEPVKVSAEPIPARLSSVLLNSYAFGGNNISVVLTRKRRAHV